MAQVSRRCIGVGAQKPVEQRGRYTIWRYGQKKKVRLFWDVGPDSEVAELVELMQEQGS